MPKVVLSSLLGLCCLSLSQLPVSLYSSLHILRSLVHLQYLDLHRLSILSFWERMDQTLSSVCIIGCIGDTFQNLGSIQHLDISEMIYVSNGINPQDFISTILFHLRNLAWLDVS